jgi:hypothetical protein
MIIRFLMEHVASIHWQWIGRDGLNYPSQLAVIGKTRKGAWFYCYVSQCGESGMSCGGSSVKVFLDLNWQDLWLFGLDNNARRNFCDNDEKQRQ